MRFDQQRPRLRAAVASLVLFATAATYSFAEDGIALQPPKASVESITFRYTPPAKEPRPKSIVVAGSFNGFSHTENPMLRGADGVYTATLQLPPGQHHYKFLIDDSRYINDPAADRSLEDKADHNNSGIMVGPDWRAGRTDAECDRPDRPRIRSGDRCKCGHLTTGPPEVSNPGR